MRKRTRKLFAVVMAVTTCVFAVMGSGCSSVSDWVKDKYDQLTCEHLTEKFIPAVAPTCTEKGSTEGIECADCGKVLTEPSEVAALGHTLEHYEALEATCMQTGLTEGEYCTVCEEWIVEQDTVKRTGHKVVTVKGKRPTCTETGLTDGQACDHCGVVYVAQKEIPMIEHYYSNGVCLNCGATKYIFDDSTKYTEVSAEVGDKVAGTWFRVYDEHGNDILGVSGFSFSIVLSEDVTAVFTIAHMGNDSNFSNCHVASSVIGFKGSFNLATVVYGVGYMDIFIPVGASFEVNESNTIDGYSYEYTVTVDKNTVITALGPSANVKRLMANVA